MGIALITNNILSDSGAPLTSVITGSLTNNYIPKATGTTSLGDSIFTEYNGNTLRIIAADAAVRLDGSNDYLLQTVDADGRFRIYDQTAAVERLTISSAGLVGIGTTSPTVARIQSTTDGTVPQLALQSTDASGVAWRFTEFAGTLTIDPVSGANRTIKFTNSGAGSLTTIIEEGNVLIGTTTDSGYKLDVSGTGRFTSTIRSDATNGFGIGSISGYRRIQYDLANTRFGLLTDTNSLANLEANAATFSSTIAATSATLSGDLTLTSTGGHTINMVATTAGSQTISMTALGGGSNTITGTGGDLNIQTTGAYPIVFKTNSVENLRIASGGAATFSSSVTATGLINANSAASAANGSINIENTDPTLRFRRTGGTANKRIYEWRAIAAGGSNDRMELRLWDDAQSSASNLFNITSAGNVGIGTTTPNATLQVVKNSGLPSTSLLSSFSNEGAQFQVEVTSGGSGSFGIVNLISTSGGTGQATSGAFTFTTRNAGTTSEKVRITSGGYVGIGTDSPGAKLEVFGTGNTFRLDSAANGAKTILLRNVGTATAEIKTDGNLDFNIEDAGRTMRFLTSNTERMRITSGGNVLIGTTTDSGYKLNVNGTGRFSDALTGTSGAFSSSLSLTKNINGGTAISVTNTNAGTSALAEYTISTNNSGFASFGKNSSTRDGAGIINISDTFIYSQGGGNISVFNNFASGQIIFAAGASTTAHFTIASTGAATFSSSVTATSFFESSSVAYKNILATNPVTSLNIDVIKYKRTNVDKDDVRYGYSAEQINSLMPELTNKEVTAVKYLDVHTLLIAELQREIKELKAKLNN